MYIDVWITHISTEMPEEAISKAEDFALRELVGPEKVDFVKNPEPHRFSKADLEDQLEVVTHWFSAGSADAEEAYAVRFSAHVKPGDGLYPA